MKRMWLSAVTLAIGLLAAQFSQAATPAKVIDNTNTTFGWQLLNDKPPAPTLEVVAGPKGNKAVQLQYKFEDGIWIAIVKNVSTSIADGEGVRFDYRGKGAMVNLKLKIYDAAGTVFGYTVPSGTNTGDWKEVIVPKGAFTYLWGGTGPGGMNWSSISKFELTLDLDAMPGVSYTVDKSKPGEIAFYSIQVVSAKGVAVKAVGGSGPVSTGDAPKVIKGSDGSFLVHSMESPAGWTSMSDQDGKIEMSSKVVIAGKKTIKSMTVNYDFGSKGIWNALILPTNLNLTDMKFFRFMFRGEGAAHKLIFKLTDASGAVFGYTLTHAVNTANWTNVMIPKTDMKYLYGGSGPNMNWGQVTKIEITIDKGNEEKATGTLNLQRLQYK